jgi:hypothetical protein
VVVVVVVVVYYTLNCFNYVIEETLDVATLFDITTPSIAL